MLRKLVAPECIFTASVCLALSPYLLGQFDVLSARYRVGLTYVPVTLWLIAWVSFLVGCMIARRVHSRAVPFIFRKGAHAILSSAAVVGLVLISLQLYFLVPVYGGLPILSYLRNDGAIDVGTANQLQQRSAYGQMGLLTFSLYTMSSVILLLILIRPRHKRGSLVLIYCSIALMSFAHLVNGKRQGLYSLVLFVVIGLCRTSGTFADFAASLGLPRRKLLVVGFLAITGWVGLVLFNVMGTLRNQGRASGAPIQSLAYLEYPLLNLEAQCAVAGLGPYEFRPLAIFRQLVPYKSLPALPSLAIQEPPTAERSSPASMLELIQWCYGPVGIAAYCVFLGWLARVAFLRVNLSFGWLIAYCYIAVCLALAQSNNQLLMMTYVPAPLATALVISRLVAARKKARLAGTYAPMPSWPRADDPRIDRVLPAAPGAHPSQA